MNSVNYQKKLNMPIILFCLKNHFICRRFSCSITITILMKRTTRTNARKVNTVNTKKYQNDFCLRQTIAWITADSLGNHTVLQLSQWNLIEKLKFLTFSKFSNTMYFYSLTVWRFVYFIHCKTRFIDNKEIDEIGKIIQKFLRCSILIVDHCLGN